MRLARTVGVLAAAALLAQTPSQVGATTDTSPPTVRIHRGLVFKVGTVLDSSVAAAGLPAKVTWTLSDNVGVTRQTARWESMYGGQVLATGGTNSPSARQFTGIPYHAYGSVVARIEAYDAAGNQGADAAGYYGALVQSDEFTRSAGWESVPCRLCHSMRATLRTTTPGASMEYQFTGQSIALIGAFAGVGGTFEVYIDGVRQGTTYSQQGTAKKMAVVYQKRFATSTTRTLKVVAVSGRVEVDALVTQIGSCTC
jgi:hypothetical protein